MIVSFVVGDTAFVVVEGLKVALGPDFQFLASAGTRLDLFAILRQENPNVLLLDPDALEIGAEDLAGIRRASDAGIVLFHEAHSPAALRLSKHAAVAACLSKTAGLMDVREALRRAVVPASELAKRPESPAHLASASSLSARQIEILGLVALGRTSKEIASLLNISPRTVDFHRAHIVSRLGLRQVADWTRFALEAGLIPAHEPYGSTPVRARPARA